LVQAKETDYKKLYEYLYPDSAYKTLVAGLESLERMIPANQTSHYTHALHPYVAKFMPQYPNLFIRVLTKLGDSVLDPMCGVGTTLIEAILNNRVAYGIDIDPLARLATKVAITPIEDRKLKPLMNNFLPQVLNSRGLVKPSDYSFDNVPNHTLWFRDDVLAEIFFIRDKITELIDDVNLQDLATIALSAIIKEVSNADPRDVMPEINHENPVNAKADVFSSFSKSLKTCMDKVRNFTKRISENSVVRAAIVGEDARKTNLSDSTIDLIVTSPPYAYAMDYGRIHKLSFFTILGMTLEQQRKLSAEYVGTDRVSTRIPLDDFEDVESTESFIENLAAKNKRRALALKKYLNDMREITHECYRVLKPNGYLVYIIGNATLAKSEFSTALTLKTIGEKFGFETKLTHERPYYARRMGRKRANHSAVTKSDVFIVLRK